MPDIETIKVLFNYGVPAILLALFLWSGYRLIYHSGIFLGPIVQSVASKHVEAMNTLEVVGKGLLQQQEAQTELMKRHDDVLTHHSVKIDEIHKAVVK